MYRVNKEGALSWRGLGEILPRVWCRAGQVKEGGAANRFFADLLAPAVTSRGGRPVAFFPDQPRHSVVCWPRTSLTWGRGRVHTTPRPRPSVAHAAPPRGTMGLGPGVFRPVGSSSGPALTAEEPAGREFPECSECGSGTKLEASRRCCAWDARRESCCCPRPTSPLATPHCPVAR